MASLSFNKILSKALETVTHGYLSFDAISSGVLRVDLGESAFGPSPKVLHKLKNLSQNISEYPIKQTVVLQHALSKKFQISRDQILISCGIDELISIIVHGCANSGDTAIAVVPTFYRLLEWSRLFGLNVLKIPLSLNDRFEFTEKVRDELVIKSQKEHAKIILLCHPNNPAGTVVPLSYVERIAQCLPQTWIVVDEAFYECLGDEDRTSAICLLKNLPNIIVLRNFSKSYGLASIRCGFLIGSAELVRNLTAIASPFAVSGISATLAVSALSDKPYIRSVATRTRTLRNEFIKSIASFSHIEVGSDSQTNMLLLRHTSKDLFIELKKCKILAADFRDIEGLEGLGFVRITIQRKEKNQRIISALRKIN